MCLRMQGCHAGCFRLSQFNRPSALRPRTPVSNPTSSATRTPPLRQLLCASQFLRSAGCGQARRRRDAYRMGCCKCVCGYFHDGRVSSHRAIHGMHRTPRIISRTPSAQCWQAPGCSRLLGANALRGGVNQLGLVCLKKRFNVSDTAHLRPHRSLSPLLHHLVRD